MDALSTLDSSRSLYLARLEHPRFNVLRLVVEDLQSCGTPWRQAGRVILLKDAHPIGPPYVAARWEVTFANFVVHAVQDEMYHSINEDGNWTGGRVRTYSRSKFLEYMKSGIAVHVSMFGAATHYSIVMENYVVDVLSRSPPEVCNLDPYAP